MTSARLGQMRRRAMLRQSKCQEKDTKLRKNGKCQYVNKMANIPCDGYNKSEIDARTEERGRSWKWFVGVVENSPWAILAKPGHHPAAVEALKARLCVDTREASRIARAAGDVIGRVDAGQALSPPSLPLLSSIPHATIFLSLVCQFVGAEQNLSEQRGTGGEGGGLSNFRDDLPAVSWRGGLKQGGLRLLRRWALSSCHE